MHKVNTPLEADVRQSSHTHSESYSSRHSGVVESHVRQESGLSRHSHHSTLVDPLPPVDHIIHPRQVHTVYVATTLSQWHPLLSSCRGQ